MALNKQLYKLGPEKVTSQNTMSNAQFVMGFSAYFCLTENLFSTVVSLNSSIQLGLGVDFTKNLLGLVLGDIRGLVLGDIKNLRLVLS